MGLKDNDPGMVPGSSKFQEENSKKKRGNAENATGPKTKCCGMVRKVLSFVKDRKHEPLTREREMGSMYIK